jgi:AcrR family transcriptional regulator
MTGTKAEGARQRVRAELTREILDTAIGHVKRDGAAGLSLRAVARDVGMVSSAIYRYFPSRDDLLTALIVSAYASLADHVENAESSARRSDLLGRWMATCSAIRGWAVAHPHEYGLIFGTPVPGYAAPSDTIEQATRVPTVLIGILRDAAAANRLLPDLPGSPKVTARELAPLSKQFPDVPVELLARGLLSWASVFGLVSFELFGHFHNVISEGAPFFEHEAERIAGTVLGLTKRPIER